MADIETELKRRCPGCRVSGELRVVPHAAPCNITKPHVDIECRCGYWWPLGTLEKAPLDSVKDVLVEPESA